MKTACEIRFGFFDITAKSDAALTSPGAQSWVQLSQLHDETQKIGKWATLEDGGWPLDGSMDILPDDLTTAFLGLWSQAQSDQAGVFSTPPWLEVSFTEPHSSVGFTLTFVESTNEWANALNIKWYGSGDAILKDTNYQPDSAVYFCDGKIENYRKVRFTFLGTNRPHHFLKLTGLQYGILKVFNDRVLLSARLQEEVDPLSDRLSINTLEFTAHAKEFDLVNMPDAYAMFQQRQAAKVLCTVDGVQSDYGAYYLDKPTTAEGRVSMSCTDLLGVIDATDYAGGSWVNGIAASVLISEIMTSAGLSAEQYSIASELASIVLTGYMEACTHREALQTVAFALCAVVNCARSDKINIYRLPESVQHTIATGDKVVGHTVSQEPLVTGVEVYRRTQDSNEETLVGSVYAAELPANAKANVKKVEGCTLLADAQALAQHIYDWNKRRLIGEGEVFPIAAKPGETISIDTASGKKLVGVMTSMSLDMVGGMIGKIDLQGGAVL